MAALKELDGQELILLKAYTEYSEAGQRYLAAAGTGKFRKRVEAGALEAELQKMQDALSTILSVAVTHFHSGAVESNLRFVLPARGRIGMSRIVDTPQYRVLNLNGVKKTAAIRRGDSNFVAVPDFSEYLVQHEVTLDAEMLGAAPLFGDLIPVQFSFAL